MKRSIGLLPIFVATGILAGCAEDAPEVAAPAVADTVATSQPIAPEPAVVSPLVRYAQDPDLIVTRAADSILLNYFCGTTYRQPCDDQAIARLAQWGFEDGKTVVDLAKAATMATAKPDAIDPTTNVSDEEFVAAAYRAVLGREADDAGLKNNLALLQVNKDRTQVLAGLIQSDEFKARPY